MYLELLELVASIFSVLAASTTTSDPSRKKDAGNAIGCGNFWR